jgi:hypothetical protein
MILFDFKLRGLCFSPLSLRFSLDRIHIIEPKRNLRANYINDVIAKLKGKESLSATFYFIKFSFL